MPAANALREAIFGGQKQRQAVAITLGMLVIFSAPHIFLSIASPSLDVVFNSTVKLQTILKLH